MPTEYAENYRARARLWLARAAETLDPELRRQFTELAKGWQELADRVEQTFRQAGDKHEE